MPKLFLKSEINGIPSWIILLLLSGLVLFLTIDAYLLYRLIPQDGSVVFKISNWTLVDIQPAPTSRSLILVMLAGALGSYVHAAHSFVTYVGLKALVASWIWWYIARPFIGMALSMIFYFIYTSTGSLNKFLFDGTVGATQDIYTLLALSSLIGMFSKQAIDKLADLFNVIFKSKEAERYDGKDGINNEEDENQAADDKDKAVG